MLPNMIPMHHCGDQMSSLLWHPYLKTPRTSQKFDCKTAKQVFSQKSSFTRSFSSTVQQSIVNLFPIKRRNKPFQDSRDYFDFKSLYICYLKTIPVRFYNLLDRFLAILKYIKL